MSYQTDIEKAKAGMRRMSDEELSICLAEVDSKIADTEFPRTEWRVLQSTRACLVEVIEEREKK